MKTRKLKVLINMDNGWLKVRINMDSDWMHRVYRDMGQGSITLGVMSLGRFSKKLKCFLLNNFYVSGPTLMELIPHIGALKKLYMHGQ